MFASWSIAYNWGNNNNNITITMSIINNIINNQLIHIISCSSNYYEVTRQHKQPLISTSIPVIWIDVYPTGENLTHMTYVRPWTGHVWKPFIKLLRDQNRFTTHGMKPWFTLGSSSLIVILHYLILPPFCQPCSCDYGSSKQLLSYVGLLGLIYPAFDRYYSILVQHVQNGAVLKQ
jgi:hypothetical protein